MLIAGLVVAGIYSTSVLAQTPTDQDMPVVEESTQPSDEGEVLEAALLGTPNDPKPPKTQCNDGKDNDKDDLIDALDPDCEDSDDDSEESVVAQDTETKVTICHWAGSSYNAPLSVSTNAIGGHQNEPMDIIPPFEAFPLGQNWSTNPSGLNETGQTIWGKDCVAEAQQDDEGTITIVKEIADGSDADAEFAFQGAWDSADVIFTLGDGESWTSAPLVAGSYPIKEVVPQGWEYPAIVCSDQTEGDDGEITIELAAGEDVACTFTNSQTVVEPQTCSLTVVSDETNIIEETGLFGVGTWSEHLAWTANIPGATWIWKTFFVENPAQEETYTVKQKFQWTGDTVTSVTLDVAADNTYVARINGTDVGSDSDLNNFQLATQDTYTPSTALIVPGENTIEVEVTNAAVEGSTAEGNPAGGLYKLIINGTTVTDSCGDVDPYDGDGEVDTILTVVKTVENDFGGTLNPWDFNLNVGWYSGNSNDESNPWRGFPGAATGTDFYVNPGEFVVGEDTYPGYSVVIDTSAGPRCTYAILHEGEHLVCPVINKQLPSTERGDEVSCRELEGQNGWYAQYFNYSWERPEMYNYYSGIPGETYEPVGDTFGVELWGEPMDSTSSSSEWYDLDEEFRFSRIDNDLEFGEHFFPFFNGAVEETVYLPNVDYHFGVHWTATVDVPVDGADYNFYGKVDDDLWIYVNGNRHNFGNPGPNGVHNPVGVTGSLNLTDGDVIDVYYAERSPSDAVMYLEFVNNTDEIKGNEIFFAPYNPDCEALACDPKVNLIENGSFEDPVVTDNGGDWQLFFSGITGWFADFVSDGNDAPLEVQAGYSGWIAGAGDQFVELDSTAPTVVSQDIETIPGAEYLLTYKRAARPGTAPDNNAVSVSVNGDEIDNYVFAATTGNPDWDASEDIYFTATTSQTRLSFKDLGSSADSLGTFIDDVGLYCLPEGAPTDAPTLTIVKNTISERDDTFGFVLSGVTEDALELTTVGGWATSSPIEINEGTTTVLENLEENWNLVGVTCEYDGESAGISTEGGKEIYAENGDEITCTFTNEYDEDGGGDGDDSCLVEGYKYDDNGNPLSGWTIGLNGDTSPNPTVAAIEGDLIGSDVTDGNGYYCINGRFSDVDTEYQVYEELQSGWSPVGVSVNGEATTTPSIDGNKAYVAIPYIGDDMDVNFYNDDASVLGYKWNDLDGDGFYDKNESNLSNWPIELYTVGDGLSLTATTTTDVNGEYLFGHLNAGSYAICEGDISGWTQTYPQQSGDSIQDGCYIVEIGAGEDISWFPFGNQENPTITTGDDDDDDNGGPTSSHRRGGGGGSSNAGEVLGATTDTQFCPFLRDYQHINLKNDPSEVNKAKAFFNSYLGKALTLNGIFDKAMFDSVWEFQSMFKDDVLNTWTEKFPGVLDNRPTGYLYQTTKWKINSIVCPGYETFPDQLVIAPGTTVR